MTHKNIKISVLLSIISSASPMVLPLDTQRGGFGGVVYPRVLPSDTHLVPKSPGACPKIP